VNVRSGRALSLFSGMPSYEQALRRRWALPVYTDRDIWNCNQLGLEDQQRPLRP